MQCEQEGETMYPVKSSKVLTLRLRAAHIILRWNEWRRRNDISRKGGEYESAKWFEVGQNGIILTARPRALSRGILTRPEAGLGNESVTMHCIWNTACRTMHALCCISLPSYGHSWTLMHQITWRSTCALTVLACGETCRISSWEYAMISCSLHRVICEVAFIINQDPNIGKTYSLIKHYQSRLWIRMIGTEVLSVQVCWWITFPAH